MKICIIGAGISGLTVGQALKNHFEIEIYEKNGWIGGIARAKMIDGVPYHLVGGHCFNSKNNNVTAFVFNKVMNDTLWNRFMRRAQIYFHDNLIDYPIEYSIRQIAQFDLDLAFRIADDFFNADILPESQNLAAWFRGTFGNTLAEEYLIPYNKKIWGMDPQDMDSSWVSGKLPVPDKRSFFKGLVSEETDQMPHSSFYYPKSNSQNSFIASLGNQLTVNLNSPVFCLEKSGKKCLINGEKPFDLIISTMPLNEIPNILNDTPQAVKDAAAKLKYNRVSNMLWKTDSTRNTWTYFPDKKSIFHRHIHIGNFLKPQKDYVITEAIGCVDEAILRKEGKKISYLKEPVDYHVSDHAYVVFDTDCSSSKHIVKSYLDSIGIYTLGRFGEWDYYNMDICIERALRLSNSIINQSTIKDFS